MEKNTFFENFYDTCSAYEDAKEKRMEERKALIKADDWDGVRAFDKKEAEDFPKPYTRGQSDAFRAYRENLYNKNEGFFEIQETPWEKDMPDFLDMLRKAGIRKILITDQSTALMESLFSLTELGCRMVGLATYERVENHWGEDEETEVRGIEMTIA